MGKRYDPILNMMSNSLLVCSRCTLLHDREWRRLSSFDEMSHTHTCHTYFADFAECVCVKFSSKMLKMSILYIRK